MKKALALILALVLLAGLCACGASTGATTESPAAENETSADAGKAPAADPVKPVVFKLGHAASDGQPIDLGLDYLAELVAERTEGRVTIQVFPGSTLGSDTEMRDMVKDGTIEMCSIGYTTMGNWYSALGLPQMLFSLNNEEELLHIVKGEWGKKYLEEPMLNDHGIRILDQWPQAPRLLMSKNPVYTLEDLNGLKLRTPAGIPVREESWTNLGAMTLSLALADAFTSINQGVCDAVELPIDYLASYHFNEQCKYLTMTRHIIIANSLMINEAAWQKLSEEDQAIFAECVELAGKKTADELAAVQESVLEEFKADGVEIIELSDEEIAKFQAVIDPLYDKYMDDWGQEAYDDLQATMAEIR